jgi:hypothetical protein
MKGCRARQCLLMKGIDWKLEEGDQNFELESNYFLTVVGDGSPDEGPYDNLTPTRHGVREIWPSNFSNFVSLSNTICIVIANVVTR